MSDLEACKGKVGVLEDEEQLAREEARINRRISRNIVLTPAAIEDEAQKEAARAKLAARVAEAERVRAEHAAAQKAAHEASKKQEAGAFISSFLSAQKD
eukprot:TRINITY_DN512_c0_g1_i1.p2 TRINITY_DN512_c0_g1~~TRINITY_DN512_c0_g1_i1.p2  ORF type:complete len:109 (-),score=51.80 TRINITY_DN512_c0_g1_i1:63-359(-)